MIRSALLVSALATMVASDSKDLDKALAGRVAGKPETCLSTSRIGSPQVIDDHTLLYRDGGRIWRNDLPDACPGLDDDVIVVTEVFGGQLCRGDLFYTLERSGLGIPGPRCRLGAFVPWDKGKSGVKSE
ncbi:hypothetical protein J2X47_000081 [Sphingomonas sp. BE270]|jgi:hypothetical protein|uniref:hypothetical protein n=1 Tax=unclassified Sphingomonas TaxID=196159 RepID=UPI000691C966|nr:MULTISPECIES: hypothetical protein [unclassified Sphingomonas]MDR6848638.1 hypothetical protein [Sphingomonas sp. BE137]MDR7255920.1 hypothetical protein [Sphingomonas sp. BE270]RUN76189.1 hypothetical protein EJC47_12460 [Sphingomonas sp. TF3]